MALLKKYKRALIQTVALCFIWLANKVSRTTAIFFGSMFGFLAWNLLKKDQHKVHRHLLLAYGDNTTFDERQMIGRMMFINFGKNIADFVRFQNHYESEIKPLITIEGLEHFDRAYKEGKGVLGITGHIGNFELIPVHMASLGYDIGVIGRELYQKRLDEHLVENRKKCGITNFSTDDSPRKILKWLSEGKALGVLIDTDSFRVRSAMLPFFGHLSHTPIGQSILGLRTKSAFIPMACIRKSDNNYHIIIKERINVDKVSGHKNLEEIVTLLCSKALEEIINENKEQWIWMHNRWLNDGVKEA